MAFTYIYIFRSTYLTAMILSVLVDGVNSSASLSSLQGVVTSTQTLRSQGPSLTPSLANYYRADLIAHVTNWPADCLEKQVMLGDINDLIFLRRVLTKKSNINLLIVNIVLSVAKML